MRRFKARIRTLPYTFLMAFFLFAFVLDAAHTNPIFDYNQGSTAQAEERYFDAIELYKASLEKNPAYIKPLLGLGECYFALGEYEEALIYIEKAEKMRKGDPEVLNLKGRVLIGLGRFKEAEETFRQVLDSEPNNPGAIMGAAELEIAGGRPNFAASRYAQVLSLDPKNRRAILSLALVYDYLGEEKKAQEHIERALQLHGEVPQVHYLAAKYYFNRNNYKKAETYAKNALIRRKDYPEATLLLAYTYIESGEYEKAQMELEHVLSRNPENHLLWYTLGLAREKRGNWNEAITAYMRALHIRSEDEITRYALEDLIIEKLPVEDQRREGIAEFHFQRGRGYERNYFFSKAVAEYRRGLKIAPAFKEGRLLLADMYRKLGYRAKYLAELQLLAREGDVSQDIKDSIENYNSILEDSVARSWDVDQMQLGMERRNYTFSIFALRSMDNTFTHPQTSMVLAKALQSALEHKEGIEFSGPPEKTESFSRAFEKAREDGSQYFVLFSANEPERYINLTATIHLARTGSTVMELSTFKSGNNRVKDAISYITEEISHSLPLRGEILKRDFSSGLINLGRYDGVEEEDIFNIVQRNSTVLDATSMDVVVDEENILGTFTVTRVDDLVSVGVVDKTLFYDLIDVGDEVFPMEEQRAEGEQNGESDSEDTDGPNEGPAPVSLYRDILEIP